MGDYEDFEYSNGANGECQQCGEDTDQSWHELCMGCWREQNGWSRPDRDALRWQHEDCQKVTLADVVARLAELEVKVSRLEKEREGAAW
jgi:hypothetical protein